MNEMPLPYGSANGGTPVTMTADPVMPATPAAPQLPPGVVCPGNYPARAKTWDFRETRNHEIMLCVAFELRTGVDKDGKATWVDFPRTKNFTFGERSEERSLESLRYMGWKGGDDLKSLFALADSQGSIREEVDADLRFGKEWEDSKGNKQPPGPEIAFINPLNGIRGQKIDKDKLQALLANAQQKKEARLGKPSDTMQNALNAQGTDDDIPF